MQRPLVAGLVLMVCSTALAKDTSRTPAGDDDFWSKIAQKVNDGYHYWLEGVQIGNNEMKEAWAHAKKDTTEYFAENGRFSKSLDDAKGKMVEQFNKAFEYTKVKATALANEVYDMEHDYWIKGDGGAFLKEHYHLSKDFWTTGAGARFLAQRKEDTIWFYTDGPAGQELKKAGKLSEEFWKGPGAEWLKKRAHESIDFVFKTIRDQEEKKASTEKK